MKNVYNLVNHYNIGIEVYELESDRYTVLLTADSSFTSATARAKKGSGCLDFEWNAEETYSSAFEMASVTLSEIPKRIKQLQIMQEEMKALDEAIRKLNIL